MEYEVNGTARYEITLAIFVKANTEDAAEEKARLLFEEFSSHIKTVIPYGIKTDVEVTDEGSYTIEIDDIAEL